jgi:type IV secretory pathway component VirB8
MTSFEDTDGDKVPNVPAKYGTMEGRKVVEDSKKIVDLLKNPNKFFFVIIGIVAAVVAVLVLIIVLIIKLIKMVVKKIRKSNKK